jgi:hypothetical protein
VLLLLVALVKPQVLSCAKLPPLSVIVPVPGQSPPGDELARMVLASLAVALGKLL